MKLFLTALAGVGFSVMLALFGAVVGAVTAGKSIHSGELAAIGAGVFDLLVWLGAALAYFGIHRDVPAVTRVLATLGFALANLLGLALAYLMTLVLLNR